MWRILFFILCCWGGGWGAWAQTLTLEEAEALAVANDPGIRRWQARALSLEAEAVAAGALPDPRFKLGMLNLPVDGFALDREPMTQTVMGLTQAFPPPGMRGRRAEALRLQAQAARARAIDRALVVLRELRLAWLELAYQLEAAKIVEEGEGVFRQLVRVTRYRYRAGRGTQHAVMRARLEQALLADRREAIVERQESWLAEVNRWLGDVEGRPVPQVVFPGLPEPPDQASIAEGLPRHPRVQAARLSLAAARKRVGVAKAAKRPAWGVELRYGLRAGGRSDFASALVNVSLPLFPAARQQQRIDARGHEVNAAKDRIAEVLRELRAELEKHHTRWARLDRRLDRYRRSVLPEASRNSESTRRAYQSRVTPFDELVRARLAELEARLTVLRLEVDRAKAYYRLRYLTAEDAS